VVLKDVKNLENTNIQLKQEKNALNTHIRLANDDQKVLDKVVLS
jgi:cell division protein FtsB